MATRIASQRIATRDRKADSPEIQTKSRTSSPKEIAEETIRQADPKNILGSKKIHPSLRNRVRRMILAAGQEGIKLYVVQGFRSIEEQDKLYRSGKGVTKAPGGFSFHNYGLAVDIAFRDEKGKPVWNGPSKYSWNQLGKIGKSLGLEWGGDWKSIKDHPHFQYSQGLTISTLRKNYQNGGMKKVWSLVK